MCVVSPQGTVSCHHDDEWAQVPSLIDAHQVTVGQTHACALRERGEAVCWGDASDGHLGDGVGTWRSTPVPLVWDGR